MSRGGDGAQQAAAHLSYRAEAEQMPDVGRDYAAALVITRDGGASMFVDIDTDPALVLAVVERIAALLRETAEDTGREL